MPNERLVADRFEVLGLAGAGGSASVYRAKDRATGGLVALKLLRGEPDAEAIERFSLEARVLEELSHPGIVRHVAHGSGGGELFLAMEWLDGVSLAKRLGEEHLTIEESIALVAAACAALGTAHMRGIVHRDVKPGNIFLVDGDPRRPKLLDFGIARLRSSSTELTQAGVVIGTPSFMAPEQAVGERAIDARADVFSLGCLFFRCLTGRNPFVGDDMIAVLAKVVLEDAPTVRSIRPDVPVAIETLVAKMLAKRPSDRPLDATAVAQALAAYRPEREAPASRREGPALTTDERRMMCILLSRTEGVPAAVPGAFSHETLRAAVASQGGRLDVLADRSLLVTLESTGTPTDNAARAARCALAMRARMPALPIVLVAGEGELRGRVAVGPVIDRGAALLASERGRGVVRLDEVIAGFLDGRFDVRTDGGALALLGERDAPSMVRTFLGRPSVCVGRERDIAMLEATFQECVDDRVARIVLVTGSAGIGKSRLLDEVLRKIEARNTGAKIWTARGDPMSAGAPFATVSELVRQAASIGIADASDVQREKVRACVARSAPPEDVERIADFLAEVLGVGPSGNESVELRAAREDALLMGDQMRRAFEDWLDAETRERPIVVVVEDLHWGDLPSVTFIDSAARHLADRSLLVIALARPDVYESFPNLWRERSLTELRLGRLSDKAAMRLVRDALGADGDEATVARIVERGDGNAFFLEELVRAAGDGKGDELPNTVLAMVQARLGKLSIEARRVLRAASIFGRSFSVEAVSTLLGAGEPPARLHAWLSELVARDVIKRPGDSRFQGELVFEHALVHEAAYSMLTDADRKLGHRLAASWLEHEGHTEAVVLAEHFERGGDLSHAVGWYWRAAEQALGGNDHASAIERIERAIRCGASGADEGSLRLIEAEARRWRGENEASRVAATRAFELLDPGSPGWCEAASELALVDGALGDVAHLAELAETLQRVEPLGGSSQLINALARIARPLFWAGKHALASATLARGRELERTATGLQPTALASLYIAEGVEARLLGDPGECVRCNELAVKESARAGDLRSACAARGNLGYAYLEIGAYEDAERVLREAHATATRMRLPLVVATAEQNLGLARARRGATDEGLRLERASLAAFEAQGDFRRAGCSLLYLAVIESEAAAFEDAARTAARAVEMLSPVEPLLASALAVQASIDLALGHAEEALAASTRAYAIHAKLGTIDEGEARVLLVHALALHASENVPAARGALAVAVGRLGRRASKIVDRRMREAFLQAIPENRTTLELAERWSVALPSFD